MTSYEPMEDRSMRHRRHGASWFCRQRRTGFAAALSAALLVISTDQLAAQSDAEDLRTDAIYATPASRYPSPQTNLFATTPGLEQQAPRSQFSFSILAPFTYNSNPLAAPADSPAAPSGEFSPRAALSWSAPLFDLPVKVSATVFAEMDRFTSEQAYGANFDKLGGAFRLQYVDPGNDQNYSPYFSYAPRLDYDPTFEYRFSTRHDLNFGFNKTFNFDGNFRRVPFSGNSFADTIWSFGLTAFVQKRFREPNASSWAFYVIPSMSYVISENWNASFGLAFMRRGFDPVNGVAREDILLEPIATLEFILPSAWFGGDRNAAIVGRPALDFQVAYEQEWSNVPGATFGAWHVGAILKMGWRF